MQVYSENKVYDLTPELEYVLKNFRKERNFNSAQYVTQKINKLNSYMREYNLKACIVAVSGGIDSALVLSIVKKAQEVENSPIKKIIAVSLPVYSNGAVNQDKAEKKAKELCDSLHLELITINISKVQSLLKETVDESLNIKGNNWADGQLVSYQRTPTLYYITSLLAQQDLLPILCGTTNKDEGAYIGYFGKASDGMVDIQLISDIHKSEVYEVSKFLNVPNSILNAIPTGDMYDSRPDEEVFGTTYSAVELYMHYKNLSDTEKNTIVNSMSEESRIQFYAIRDNLEKMHKYNKHKYLGMSPAVHLDLMDSQFEGGWKYNVYK